MTDNESQQFPRRRDDDGKGRRGSSRLSSQRNSRGRGNVNYRGGYTTRKNFKTEENNVAEGNSTRGRGVIGYRGRGTRRSGYQIRGRGNRAYNHGQKRVVHFPIENENFMKEDVVSYGKKNNIMYIMRGLPGSGKSTVAQRIKQSYPDGSVVICSADNFRYDAQGRYVWDPEKLKETHQRCQNRAYHFLQQAFHVIVIDNTNIQSFEYQCYLSMAYQFGYVVVFITMQSRDINSLGRNNIHGVSTTKIRDMNSHFGDVEMPYFYSWSVPKTESSKLRDTVQNMLLKCQENVQSFKNTLATDFHTSAENSLTTYNLRLASSKDCHITAAFIEQGKVPRSAVYHNSSVVKNALGSVSELKIIGWCITPRSIFCRIKLSDDQKSLWGRNDSAYGDRNNIMFESAQSIQTKTEELFEGLSLQKTTEHCFQLPKAYIKPNHRIGSTAHITLGVSAGLRPVVAKDDLFKLVHLELFTNWIEEYQLGNILLRKYSENIWTAYLKRPKQVPAIFCGSYKH